jgi:hypothetical protein
MRMIDASKHEEFPMQQIPLLEQVQPAQSAAARARSRPIAIRFGVVAVALVAIAAWCQPAAAALCRVPAGVLCEGCVERLSIRVAPGGTCRISFTPATPPEQAGSTKFVDINIETAPPRATIHRVSAPHSSIGGHPRLRESPVCFVFNGRRFCE